MDFTSSRHLKPAICAALAAIVTTVGVNVVITFAAHGAAPTAAAAPDRTPVARLAAAPSEATEPGRARA